MKLKEMIDSFGWDKIQQGQLPTEIKPESEPFTREVHQWDLYALNGVYAVVMDRRVIFELSGIKKTSHGYERTAHLPQNTVVHVDNVQEFLKGFKHLHNFRNPFLYVREEGMHFDGIGRRLEDAGELNESSETTNTELSTELNLLDRLMNPSNLQRLKGYFDTYNEQIQQFGAKKPEVNTSGKLSTLVRSIDGLKYENHAGQGIVDHWNARSYDSRHSFCKAVVSYFIETGEVPDFNAKEIVEAAEEMTLGHVADSFHKFAKKLEEKVSSTRVTSE